MGRTVIVGDIHGCLEELRELLSEVSLSAEDRLVSVGDLVGKGPAGDEVVRFFRVGGHEAVVGNHDEKVLAWRHGDRDLSGAHLRDARGLGEEDWRWLEALGYTIALPEHGALVVHAGLVPGRRLDEQTPADLTRLRSIRADGSGSARLEDGEPWASLWPGPELVVFGHDAVRGLQLWPHAIGLDTGCVYGGQLTALVLPGRTLVSVDARRAYAGTGG